jgi:hypothetical protein
MIIQLLTRFTGMNDDPDSFSNMSEIESRIFNATGQKIVTLLKKVTHYYTKVDTFCH